jgi:hypothetical protein
MNDQSSATTDSVIRVSTLVAWLKRELGGESDLVRQCLADLNSLERQGLDHHVNARLEFAKQIGETERARMRALIEYGLQTLRWLFLMNAGVAGLIVAYVGAKAAQSGIGPYIPLLRALLPFGAGCVLIAIAGAAGYFNFVSAMQLVPDTYSVHQFTNPTERAWPKPQGIRPNESLEAFYARISKSMGRTQRTAVVCAIGAGISFVIGILCVFAAL